MFKYNTLLTPEEICLYEATLIGKKKLVQLGLNNVIKQGKKRVDGLIGFLNTDLKWYKFNKSSKIQKETKEERRKVCCYKIIKNNFFFPPEIFFYSYTTFLFPFSLLDYKKTTFFFQSIANFLCFLSIFCVFIHLSSCLKKTFRISNEFIN